MKMQAASWGCYPRVEQRLQQVASQFAALPAAGGPLLPRGNGRSYGDVCLNQGGTLLGTHHLDHFQGFDVDTGVLRCEAGVLLRDILRLVVTRGWFLPVVPGTQLVTLGGAIANDVHGKNHHVAGSFGCHVRRFELLRSDGSRLVCSPDEHAELFAATIGGLGLTGLITWAEIQLQPVPGAWFATETRRFATLADFFSLSAESAAGFDYSVAWVDCVARGERLGRGVFSRGNHCAAPTGRPVPRERHLSMLLTPPFSLVNGLSLHAFNTLYFHRAPADWRRAERHYASWLFPLDGIAHWNHMYGPSGFLQYQCVLPPEAAADGVRDLLDRIAASGSGSFLAVLKQFGNRPSPGLLSFPRSGTTLALDFANQGERTFRLLDSLDEVVASGGGAVYPAKDARMSGARFRQYFPQWVRLEELRDPAFSSSFWRRVTTT